MILPREVTCFIGSGAFTQVGLAYRYASKPAESTGMFAKDSLLAEISEWTRTTRTPPNDVDPGLELASVSYALNSFLMFFPG